jgi:hypothetical protein
VQLAIATPPAPYPSDLTEGLRKNGAAPGTPL